MICGLSVGFIVCIKGKSFHSLFGIPIVGLIYGLIYGLSEGLEFGLWMAVYGGIIGGIGTFIIGYAGDISPVETISYSWKSVKSLIKDLELKKLFIAMPIAFLVYR